MLLCKKNEKQYGKIWIGYLYRKCSGFVNLNDDIYTQLTEKEAEQTAKSFNESIGMYDTKENAYIVLSTMKDVRRS